MTNPPNILFLFPDQWRWDWLGCETSPYGKVPVQTPAIDELAAQGVRFSGCRTNAPVCSPARGCFATGRRYHNCRVASNRDYTPTDVPTVFALLRDAGYHTATCGKSDLFKPHQEPTQTGFLPIMEDYGFTDGIDHRGKGDAIVRARKGIDEPYTLMLRQRGLLETHLGDHPAGPLDRPAGPTPLPRDAYTDDFCGQNAVTLLERAPTDKPWCLWVNFPGPHDPYDPPAEVLERYRDVDFPAPVNPTDQPPAHRDPAKDRPNYAACCSNIDEWASRILQAIEARGERDNTIVIFASDHGEMLGDHGRWQKSTWHEASIRVPLIVAGPGITPGKHTDTPVELIDIAATMLAFAGVDVPGEWDARALTGVLDGSTDQHRDFAVSQLGNWRCITSNAWKYIEQRDGTTRFIDLANDPSEIRPESPATAVQREAYEALLRRENPWFAAD